MTSNQLDRWIIEHFESEDYIEIQDYISRCDLNELEGVMELCNIRIHDFNVLATIASKRAAEKLKEPNAII